MKEYVYVLILTAVMAAVAELLTDGEGASNMVRMVAGLCVLVALIQPIKEGIAWLGETARGESVPHEWLSLPDADLDAEAVFNQQLSDLSRREVERAAETILDERFGVRPEDCRVEATVESNGEQMSIQRVYVLLSGSAVLKNPHTIEAFLEQTFGGDCVVAVE